MMKSFGCLAALLGLLDLGSAQLSPDPNVCSSDVNGDSTVDVNDLLQILSSYGSTAATDIAGGDTNGDGIVDVNDLLGVLSAYGVRHRRT